MKDLSYLDVSSIFSNKSIKAFFSLRKLSKLGKVTINSFAREVGFNPSTLLIPNQVHSSKVSFYKVPGEIPECDGAFTNQRNIVCSIKVADCLPIYFVHRFELLFGIIHAGWRGLVNDIIFESGRLLKKNNYKLADFEIYIGPSIRSCCFEVGHDIIDDFHPKYVENINGGKFKVDLQNLAMDKLMEIKIKRNNIYVNDNCTSCNHENYFSYRRDGKLAGRMFGLLGIK